MRDHSSWAPCGIEMLIRSIFKCWFWISLHQGMLSILCFRIQDYMLSLMNEVDPCLLFLLCVLYEMQNQILQYYIFLMWLANFSKVISNHLAFTRLIFVGKEFWQTCQVRFFIFAGTFKFQLFFPKGFKLSTSEGLGYWDCCLFCKNM